MKVCFSAILILLASCALEHHSYRNHKLHESFDVHQLEKALDVLMTSKMEDAHIPGASLSVIKGEEVILTKAFGVRNADTKDGVTKETVFEFASLSKPVFALAVMKLAEQGKINLDRPLWEYLEKQNASHDSRYKRITANMVLSHTTGFPNWARGKPIEMAFTPGERFRYSGEGYYYLQKVVEKLTKIPLQDIVEEQVFIPLQMAESSFVWKNEFDPDMAYGHSKSGHVVRKIHKRYMGNSASSLISNVEDYSKFVSHILNEYKRGNPIIKGMVRNRIQVKDCGKWGKLFWSSGWGIEETRQGKNIWHWGNNGEFRSLVVANLENSVGLVYVANSAGGLKPIGSIIDTTVGGVHPLIKFEKVH